MSVFVRHVTPTKINDTNELTNITLSYSTFHITTQNKSTQTKQYYPAYFSTQNLPTPVLPQNDITNTPSLPSSSRHSPGTHKTEQYTRFSPHKHAEKEKNNVYGNFNDKKYC